MPVKLFFIASFALLAVQCSVPAHLIAKMLQVPPAVGTAPTSANQVAAKTQNCPSATAALPSHQC